MLFYLAYYMGDYYCCFTSPCSYLFKLACFLVIDKLFLIKTINLIIFYIKYHIIIVLQEFSYITFLFSGCFFSCFYNVIESQVPTLNILIYFLISDPIITELNRQTEQILEKGLLLYSELFVFKSIIHRKGYSLKELI